MISSSVRQLEAFSESMGPDLVKKRLESVRNLVGAANGILESYENVFKLEDNLNREQAERVDAPVFFGRIAEEFESVAGDTAAIHFTSSVSECFVDMVPILMEHAVWDLLSGPVPVGSDNRSVRFEISVRENMLVFKVHNSPGPNTGETVREAEWLVRAAGGRLVADETVKDGRYVLEIPIAAEAGE